MDPYFQALLIALACGAAALAGAWIARKFDN